MLRSGSGSFLTWRVGRTSLLRCHASTGNDEDAAKRQKERDEIVKRERAALGLGPQSMPYAKAWKELGKLTPKEQLQRAMSERSALRLDDLPEGDRETIARETDSMAPFRDQVSTLATIVGAVAIINLLFQFPGFVFGRFAPEALLSPFFTALVAAALFFSVGLMAPSSVPSVKDIIRDMEEYEAELMMLIGTWHYGIEYKQTFCISRDADGTWKYKEQLNGTTYSSILSPNMRWLQGELMDDSGKNVGMFRVRLGKVRKGTVVSYIKKKGEAKWGNEGVAFASASGPESWAVPGFD